VARSPSRKSKAAGGVAGFFAFLVKAGVIFGVAGVLALTVAVAITYSSLPDFDAMMRSPNGQSVEIKASDGAVLAALGPSYGEWLPYARIPKTMTGAMIAVEDRRFYSHPGIDPIGIVRSAVVNFKAGRSVQGASTITQQLARNVFLTST
jgi:penicillin-binding protein 1A